MSWLRRLWRMVFRPNRRAYVYHYGTQPNLIWADRKSDADTPNILRYQRWIATYQVPFGFHPYVPVMTNLVERHGKNSVVSTGKGILLNGKPASWGIDRLKEWERRMGIVAGSRIMVGWA